MKSIEEIAVQTYQDNLGYIQDKHPKLMEMLDVLNRAIENGDYAPRYDLEYLEGYFDVKELQSGHYLYSGNSEHISKEFSKSINFNKNSYSFEGLPVYHHSTIIENNASDKARGMEGIYPIMDYYIENTKEDDVMSKIEKFLFVGVGLGLHIPIITSKITPKEYMIIEDDLELFRLSLFTIQYFELAKSSDIIFAIADDDNLFLQSINPFLENNFFENRFIKYAHFPTHSKHKLKQIQHAILSQNFITFQYKIELEKYLRPLEYINDGYRILNISSPIKNDLFSKKPVILVTAGPSLKKNMEWLEKNHKKFIVVAVSATLKTLKTHNITPDIVTHIDGFEASLKHFEGFNVKEFLKNSTIILGPFAHSLVKYFFDKSQVYYYEEDSAYVDGFGSLSAPCVGSFSLLMSLILDVSELYLLGLDFAVDQKTGATHSSEHVYSEISDMQNRDSVSQEMNLRENLLPVKGNFADKVYTNTLFNFSVKALHKDVPKIKQPHQVIYNLNDGAYIEGSSSKRVEDVGVEMYDILDKTIIQNSINSILHDNSIGELGQADMQSLTLRYEYITQIEKFLKEYAQSVTKTNAEKYLYDLLGVVSKILTKRERETQNIVHVYYTYFRHVLPIVFDFFNTKGLKNKKNHIKKLDAMIQGEMMEIEGVYSKTLREFLAGDKSNSKENEYKFLATIYSNLDEERLKNSYTKDTIGFLAVEENLNDDEFVSYIKALYKTFSQVRFKAFYFDTSYLETLRKTFHDELDRFDFIIPQNIYDLASELTVYIHNNKASSLRTVYELLFYTSEHIHSVNYFREYKSLTLKDQDAMYRNANDIILNNPQHFSLQENGEQSFYKMVYNPILHDINEKPIEDLSMSLDKFEHFEKIRYSLQSDEFIKDCYNRNIKYRDF